MTDLPQSVLRYWESVFNILKPAKSPGGSRQYSESDIQLIKLIKLLLYEQGYTIKGAVNKLNKLKVKEDLSSIIDKDNALNQIIKNNKQYIIKEIKEIIRILES